MHTVESLLRGRRLKWWREIRDNPHHNAQLLAALLGTLELEEYMNTYTGPTPWIEQILRDMDAVASKLRWEIVP